MTDREKLIEILRTSCAVGKDFHKSCIECTADHLLANGVTIAPEKPRTRPKGWQPMGARSFIKYCPTCKNDGSDLCDLCVIEIKSGYDPKDTVRNTEWISVTERLPELEDSYLVAVKYKYDFEKEFTYDTDVATFYFGDDRRYIDGQWNTYVDWDEGQQYLHVTHWMPLPSPPSGYCLSKEVDK